MIDKNIIDNYHVIQSINVNIEMKDGQKLTNKCSFIFIDRNTGEQIAQCYFDKRTTKRQAINYFRKYVL